MRTGLALVFLCGAANAFEFKGRLAAENGEAADFSDSVVWVDEGEKLPHPPSNPVLHAMNQVDKAFAPSVLVIRKGDSIRFENLDTVFHNVFSLDRRNRFDLGLFKGSKHFAPDLKTELHNSSATMRAFSEDGKFYVFCNIHPDMAGTVYVFDHPFHARADKDGFFSLPLPGTGTYALAIDGPRLSQIFKTSLKAAEDAPPRKFSLKLIPSPRKIEHSRKNGGPYPAKDRPY